MDSPELPSPEQLERVRVLTREVARTTDVALALRAVLRAALEVTAVYHKPRELTVTEKALMVEKGRRTRERRHTLGPKAKEAVKGGDVSSVTLPRPSPASPATPGSPGTSTATPTSVPA